MRVSKVAVIGVGAMLDQTIAILNRNAEDAELGELVKEAIHILGISKVIKPSGTSRNGQSSRSLADLHEFRRRIGYYREEFVLGLPETIKALRADDVLVNLRSIETDLALIGVWIDRSDSVLGVIIARRSAGSVDHLTDEDTNS